MVTRSDMTCSLLFRVTGSSVCVQGLPRQGQVCLAEGLVLGRVRVDETSDVLRVRVPVDDELRLADLLAHPGADHVHTDDGSVLRAHELDEALRPEDLGLAVAAEVVLVGLDLTVLLAGLSLGQADARDLGVAVGDAGGMPLSSMVASSRQISLGDASLIEDAPPKVAIWDLPTRLFHWTLAGLIAVSWWAAEYHHDDLHIWSGMAASPPDFPAALGICRRLDSSVCQLRHGAASGIRIS